MTSTKERSIEEVLEENRFLHEENETILRRKAELETLVQHQSGLLLYHGATNNYVEFFKKVDENRRYSVLFLDPDYRILALSETAIKKLGYKTEEELNDVIGKRYTELMIAEESRLEFVNLVARGKITGKGFSQKLGIKKNKGMTYVKSRVILYMKTGRNELIGLLIRFHKPNPFKRSSGSS